MLVAPLFSTTPVHAEAHPASVSPVVSAAGFTHPGVFVSLDELRTTKAHVLAGDKPWVDDFRQLKSSPYAQRGAPTFKEFASAHAADPQHSTCSEDDPAGCVTLCGSYNNPDVGCSAEQDDARAVYGQALLYWYTGDTTYAKRAVAILNAYAHHFKGNTGSNGPLMTAWTAEQMIRGAELLRYTYRPSPRSTVFDVHAFSAMLRKVFVPTLTSFDYGTVHGNWQFSAADGLMNIAVFLDDRALYDHAITMWRKRVMSYIYLSTDGVLPIPPPNYSGQDGTPATLSCLWLDNKTHACETDPKTDPHLTFQNGQSEETCRDFLHTSMGLSGIVNTAETAWIQGLDLYGEQQRRILTGVLYTIQIAQEQDTQGMPAGFCSGVKIRAGRNSLDELAADVVFNAYAVRKGVTLSAIDIPGYATPSQHDDPLARFIAQSRANDGHVGNLVAWDSLTHHLASAPVSGADGGAASPTPGSTGETSAPDDTPSSTPPGIADSPTTAPHPPPFGFSGPSFALGVGFGLFIATALVILGVALRRRESRGCAGADASTRRPRPPGRRREPR